MKNPIGFSYTDETEEIAVPAVPAPAENGRPVRSLVQVSFQGSGITLGYYNDLFDLRAGDTVFVEGKYEGVPGRVVSLTRKFRISPLPADNTC